MSKLKEKLFKKIQDHRPRITKLLKEHGNTKVGEVTIAQAIGGARGVRCLVTDISYLDPFEGIRFRGKTIPETFAALPKVPGRDYAYVEGFWAYLLTGDIPTKEEVLEIVEDFKTRSALPEYVKDMLRAMQRESLFVKRYTEGMKKDEYWDPMYEDSTTILAKLPELGAYIYRMKYKADVHIPANRELDMGGNFAHMMGFPKPYDDVARMYFILHSDHESGNVSAHTTHLVASALSDAYYSLSAGINGLAGPLHGLANQEVLRWVMNFQKKLGDKEPTEELVKEALWATLKSGQVIPGYGHAVLRKTDPRYVAQMEFCQKNLPNYPLFKLINMIYKVAPGVLTEHGKTKNPWPNVDAQSGVIQWYYGLTEWDFYTVLFGIGRAIGVLANITWDRALGYAIERPKSVTTKMLEDVATQAIKADDLGSD
jgi:citrate synthase